MVRVIMENAGAGKTKQIIDLVNAAVETEHGNVVCIEKKSSLRFNIHHDIRLVPSSDYEITSFDVFKGFISGMYAGNYDITHIFIDNLCKIVSDWDMSHIEAFLNWLDVFGEENNIKFTLTMTSSPEDAPEGIKKFF